MRILRGVTPGELAAIGGRLEAFAEDIFESLPRADQRARGECYLRGLMLEGRRKSVAPMAARLGGEVHYQALHHFVSVNAVTEQASCPLSWRLVVPAAWDEDAMAERRAACHLPEGCTIGRNGSWWWTCWMSWSSGAAPAGAGR